MNGISSATVRRLLAVGLLMAAVAAPPLLGVLPIVRQIEAYDLAIAEREALLAETLRIASRHSALAAERRALADALASGAGFLEGDSAELIAARLQEQLKQLAGRAGVRLDSTQALVSDDDSGFRRVTLRVGLTASMPALQALLHALETATPLLFVDDLALRPAALQSGLGEAGMADLLQVRFDFYGFVRGIGAPA